MRYHPDLMAGLNWRVQASHIMVKQSTTFRKSTLGITTLIGCLAAIAAGFFAIAGAGIFGTPFQGDPYFNITLMLVLVFGPFAIIPSVGLDLWKPRWGGIVLCAAATITVVMFILNNIRMWGFAIHDAALGTLCIAVPEFILGSILLSSATESSKSSRWLWRGELDAFTLLTGYLFLSIAPDTWYTIRHLAGA